jgi:hypothetical protein
MTRNAKKNTTVAALVGAAMLGGTAVANGQQASSDVAGPRAMATSDRMMQVRSDRRAGMQVRSDRRARAQNRQWHAQNRGWNDQRAWNGPLGWPDADATGAGFAAGAVIGGSVAAATGSSYYDGYPYYAYAPHGHVYGSQGYGAFAQEGAFGWQGGPSAPVSYDSGGAAIFANQLGPYCTLGMKEQQRC